MIQTFQTDLFESSTKSSLVKKNSCFVDYPVFCRPYFTSVLSQLSSHIIIYFILGVKSCSPTLLVVTYTYCRPPSHQLICYILKLSPFLTKCVILEMCLLCLVSLPFLAIHTSYLPSNIIRGSSSGTISGSFFNNKYLTSWNVWKPYLQFMLHCTHFLHLIEQLVVEHVFYGQFSHLDKIWFMLLYFCQCLDNLTN